MQQAGFENIQIEDISEFVFQGFADYIQEQKSQMSLSHVDQFKIKMTAKLCEKDRKFGETRFEIIQSNGLAFDHAAIIAAALSKLRSCIGDFDIIFDFLPEKFTLASLQRVMETVGGISVLPANFRRKVSDFVEETDEFIKGAGHRPAKLFKKK